MAKPPRVHITPIIDLSINDISFTPLSLSWTQQVRPRVSTSGGASIVATTGRATLRTRADNIYSVPSPWNGSNADWAPRGGDRVNLQVRRYDNADFVPVVKGGAVDSSQGTFGDPVVSVDFLDSSDKLGRAVTTPAMVAVGGGMTSVAAVVDMVARACGYFTTPDPIAHRLAGLMCAATLAGHNMVTPNSGYAEPMLKMANAAYANAPWGPALTSARMTLDLRETNVYQFTACMEGDVEFRIRPSESAAPAVTIRHVASRDRSLRYELVVNGQVIPTQDWFDITENGRPVTYTLKGLADGRTEVYLSKSNGGAWVRVATVPAGARTAASVVEWAGGMIGGLVARKVGNNWNTLTTVWHSAFNPSMRFRISGALAICPAWAVPAVRGRVARDVLSEIASAVCATVRVAPDGVLEWTSAYWRPPTTKELTSLDDIYSLSWESRLLDMPRRVVIDLDRPSFYGGYVGRAQSQTVWMPSPIELSPGQDWNGVAAPADNEDWVNPDTSLSWSSTGTGSEASFSAGEASGVSLISSTLANGAISMRITNRGSQNATFYARDGSPTPIIRADYKVTWASDSEVSEYFGPDASGDYVHKGGRWVSDGRVLSELKTFIVDYLKNRQAQIKAIEIVPDFTLDVGDYVRIKDEHSAGLIVTGTISKIDTSINETEARQVIEVDVDSVTPATVKPLGT